MVVHHDFDGATNHYMLDIDGVTWHVFDYRKGSECTELPVFKDHLVACTSDFFSRPESIAHVARRHN